MTELDRRAQVDFDLPGLLLMEHAALKTLRAMQERYGRLTGQDVALLCGGGNNGGDGFALARLLQREGARPRVLPLADPARLEGDAARNFASLAPAGIPDRVALADLGEPDLVVDAMLGTGAQGAPRGAIGEAIERLGESAAPVVAVDIPSGLPGNGGQPLGGFVRADLTVTMGLPKPFALCPVCRPHVGSLAVARIGFPPELLGDPGFSRVLAVAGNQDPSPLERPGDAHKGSQGRLLVIGGAPGMGGAAMLAARGALRAGAGLVKVLGPPGLRSELGADLPEVMVLERHEGLVAQLEPLLEWADAVVLGPGLGEGSESREVWRRLLELYPGPVVVDADGLRLLASEGPEAPGYRVHTPHPGEAGRLLGRAVGPDLSAREEALGELLRRYRGDWVLKGRFTLVGGGAETWGNPTGSPALATGGTGDVLAGTLGALLARRPGGDPRKRVRLGVYLHGLAGNLAGSSGILASEVADCLPRAAELLRSVSGELSAEGYPELLPQDGLELV